MKSVFSSNDCCDYNRLIKKIEKYDIVSFDVFDTLIKRNVNNPVQIFQLLGLEIEKKYAIKNFCEIRINSEKALYKSKEFVTLNDIYEKMSEIISKDLLEEIKEIEIEYEISYCQENIEIKKVYEYCRRFDKKILAISDMYLPLSCIEKMLKKCGYSIDSIYVSCEENAKKKSGMLFDKVIKLEKIEKKSMLHIGDSYKADILGAKKVGVSSIHISRVYNKFNTKRFDKYIDNKKIYDIHKSIINNNLGNCNNYYEQFGYAYLGPLVFSFSIWLKNKCIEKGLKDIFFFARDGYILKKAFDIINNSDINTHYLYVSRRALRIPYHTEHNSFEEILNKMPKTKMLSVDVFFSYLGFDANKYQDILNKYNLKIDDVIYYNDLKTNKTYVDIFDILKEEFLDRANFELNELQKYLEQENFSGRIAAVDVGWHNSMQFFIEELFSNKSPELELNGFYVGIQPNGKKVRYSEGFISDYKEDDKVKSVEAYIGLIESLFLSQEGSVEKYQTVEDVVEPVLFPYEYENGDIETYGVVELQKGAYKYMQKISELRNYEELFLEGHDAYLPLKTYGLNPYLYDVHKFSDFRYYSEEIVYLAKSKSVFFYLLHLKQLKHDLYKARWKTGFMKRLFKINLPYYGMYKFLKGQSKIADE